MGRDGNVVASSASFFAAAASNTVVGYSNAEGTVGSSLK